MIVLLSILALKERGFSQHFDKMTFEPKARFVNGYEFSRLLKKNKLVVADYTATWCGPCRVVTPSIDKLAVEYGDRVEIVKIDVDENRDVAKKYDIRSIPAVLIFRDRQVVKSFFGIQPYETYRDNLAAQLEL